MLTAMHFYLFIPFLLTTQLVKAESPPVNTWNSGNERTLHGPVPSFLLSLPCPSEGYFRHPKYCSQFYRCVDVYGSKRALSLFQGTCEPGLVFDEKISSCNWPDLSPPCSGYEISQQPVHHEDHPSQFEISSQPEFPKPGDQERGFVQQVFEVFTGIPSTKPLLATEKPSQHQEEKTEQRVQQEEIWQQSVPEQIHQDAQQPTEQQVHQQQKQQEIPAGHQQQLEEWPQEQQKIQQADQQVQQEIQHVQQQVQQQVQQETQTVYQEPHQIQEQVQHQERHQQQHVEQQLQQEVFQQEQKGTSGSGWWIPDEESAWTTKAVQHDVQNIINNEELLCNKEGFFQHPGNCSKFYRCVRRSASFEIFVFECPQFLVFNQSAGGCHRSDNQACVTLEAAYRRLRSKRSVSESSDRLEALTLPCPEEGFFRHPKHCQVFYRCVQSSQRSKRFSIHTFVCPKNLVFDEKKGTCDWPEKSTPCSDNSMSISGTTPKSSRTTRQPLRTTRQPARTTRQPLRATRQPARTTRQQLRTTRQPARTTRQPSRTTRQPLRTTRQPLSATRKPPRTTPQPSKVSQQQRFSTTRQPSSKQKSKNKNENRTDQVQRRPNTPRPGDQAQRRPSVPQSGYQVKRRPDTPRPGNQGRDKLKLTQSTERPRTQKPVISDYEVNCRGPGFFTNRSDCNKYYKCVDRSGKGQYFLRYDFACPQNLAFDEVTGTCKSRNRVAYCRKSQTNLAALQDDPSQTETTSTASVSEGSPESEDQTSKSPESSSSQGGDKECTQEGYFRDPQDCNKFYRCVDFNGDGKQFVRYDFSCPEGLVFDEENSVCNWPSSSEPCESGSSSGPSDRGETTSEPTSQDQSTTDGTSQSQTTSEATSQSQTTSDGASESQSTSGGTSQGQDSSTSSGTSDAGTDSATQAQTDSTDDSSETSGSSGGTTESSGSTSEHTDSAEEQESSSQTSSTSKGNNGECKEEGYFRDPDDCSKFYRCVDFKGDGKQFVRYNFSCPEGLEFDEVNSVCNWPSSDSPCSGRSSEGGGTQSPSSTSGEDSSSSSGTDSTTSTSEQDTTEEKTTESSDKDETSTESESSTSDSSASSSSDTTTSSSDTSTSTTSDSSTSSSSDTTTSSSDTSTSTTSDSSTSSSSDTTTSSTSDTSTTTTSTSSGDSSESESGEDVTSESSAKESESTSDSSGPSSDSECTEEGFFRNPDDCTKFYRCVDFNGDGKQFVRYDFDCPEGLVFDEVNSVCNWPDKSPPCDSEPKEPGETTTSASSESTDSETDTSSTTEASPEGTTDSATDTSAKTEQTTETSSEGTTDSATDTSSTTEQTTETSSEGTTDSTTDAQSTASETKATSEENETTEGQSETTTSASQTSSSGGQTTDSSGTTSGEGSSECTEEGYFRDPEDCRKFHRCVDSKGDGKEFVRYDFECPEGLVFDDRNNKCNWPEESPPCESGSEEKQTTEGSREKETESTTKSGETDSTSASTDSGSESTTSKSSTTSSTQSEECTEEGYFRDSSDCRKYYRCIENDDGTFEKQEFSCEEDEVFDPDKQFCDKKELNPSCPDSTTEETDSTTEGTDSTTEGTSSATEGTDSTTKGTDSTTKGTDSTTKGTDSTSKGTDSTTEGTDTATETTETTSSTATSTTPSEESSTEESEKTTSSAATDNSSTTKSSTTKECTEEGFFRDPDDCTKFYRCVDFRGDGKSYVRYDFECPEGLVFDEENSVCNWPSDVPECESSASEEGTSSSKTQTDSTSTSTTTSQETTSSTESEESESSTGADSSDTSTSQGQTDSSSTTASSSSSTTSSTSSSKSESEDDQCTEEGFFRHPDDCTKFYRCVDFNGDGKQFVRYDFECPEGLVFDESISVCNWPQDSPPCETSSDKGSGSSTSTESTSKGSGQESTTSSKQRETTEASTSESGGQTTENTNNSGTTTTSETSGTTSSSSNSRTTTGQKEKESGKSECKEEGFFRHPEDCTKYYRCLRNNETGELEKTEYDCPEDTVFDEEGRYCNEREFSPPCNSSESFECTEEGFFRDPEDCTKYIQCTKRNDSDSYEQKRFQCPENHVFDEEGRYCNAKELSPPCDDEGEGEDSTTSGTGEGQPEGEGSTTPGETTSEGQPEGEESTTSGEETSKGQTDEDQTSSSDSFECKEEGFFRDPEDCTKYYQCSKRNDSSGTLEKKKHSCPEDHVFDEEGRYCNSVDLAPPCDESESSDTTSGGSSTTQSRTTANSAEGGTENSRSGSSTEAEKNKSEQTDNEGASSTTKASSKTTSSSSTSSSSSSRQSNSECKEEGFFRNPDHCDKFYRCVDFSGSGESFVRYDFDCPEGLVFDEINSVCTWPDIYPPCENKQKDSENVFRIPIEAE